MNDLTKVELYVLEDAIADYANASKNPKHWEIHQKITTMINVIQDKEKAQLTVDLIESEKRLAAMHKFLRESKGELEY
jgi:hypothetical protein